MVCRNTPPATNQPPQSPADPPTYQESIMVAGEGLCSFDLARNGQARADISKGASLDDWETISDGCLQQSDDARYEEYCADDVGQICMTQCGSRVSLFVGMP